MGLFLFLFVLQALAMLARIYVESAWPPRPGRRRLFILQALGLLFTLAVLVLWRLV